MGPHGSPERVCAAQGRERLRDSWRRETSLRPSMKATWQLEGVGERRLGSQRHLVSGLVTGQMQGIFPTMEGRQGLGGAPSLSDKDQAWEQRPCPHPSENPWSGGMLRRKVLWAEGGPALPLEGAQFPLEDLPSPTLSPRARSRQACPAPV